MKYFNNITTAEELKKQFRAYCVTMHPDKGGDPEDFKPCRLLDIEDEDVQKYVGRSCGIRKMKKTPIIEPVKY